MEAAKMKEHMVVANPADFHWKPKETLPAGAMAANVYGDPTKGNYAFYSKFPAKYTVPQHWHTDDCMVAIIKGSMRIDPENAASVNIQEGGFFKLPGHMRYVAHTPKETIFLVWEQNHSTYTTRIRKTTLETSRHFSRRQNTSGSPNYQSSSSLRRDIGFSHTLAS